MRVLLLLVSMFLVCGCGKSFNDQPSQDVTTKYLENVKISVLEGQEVGEYSVQFIPKDTSKYSIIKHDFLNGEISEIAVGVSGEYTDLEVISGYIYKYEIGEFIEDKSFQKLFEKEVRIPVDIKLKETESRSLETQNSAISTEGHSVLTINRLSLAKGSKLITEGKKIHLKVNRLLSHKGSILTFNRDAKAEKGVMGRSGGELIIDAQYANGDLHIELIGESGGDGIRPKALGEDGRGKTGVKGSEGFATIDLYYGPMGGDLEPADERCITVPGKGGNGGKGKTGLPGNPGLSGGDSGIALIYIEESDNFNVTYEFAPGDGGIGSKGGLGGPGGQGGEPGKEKVEEQEYVDGMPSAPLRVFYYDIPKICSARWGDEGFLGETGSIGIGGSGGKVQKICIKKNKNNRTECFNKSA